MGLSLPKLKGFLGGRATRREYWIWATPIAIILACTFYYDLAIQGPETIFHNVTTTDLKSGLTIVDTKEWVNSDPRNATYFALLVGLVPFTVMLVRRMHDIGYPAWYAVVAVLFAFGTDYLFNGILNFIGQYVAMASLILGIVFFLPAFLIPGLAGLLIFLWGFTPSQPGTNEYGPNPHEVTQ